MLYAVSCVDMSIENIIRAIQWYGCHLSAINSHAMRYSQTQPPSGASIEAPRQLSDRR
jgi:hypothetical protein